MALSKKYTVTVNLKSQDSAIVITSVGLSSQQVTGVGLLTGPAGAGVAKGGTVGQVLTKGSSDDYDTLWADSGGGGGGSTYWGTILGNLTLQTDLQSELDLLAPKDSPALTGTPTTPLPVSDSGIANKGYVDATAQGLSVKLSVAALASTNVTRSGEQTIDDIALVAGDRVLLIGQTTASQNGIWVVQLGAWNRPSDFAQGSLQKGVFTFVVGGTEHSATGWVLSGTATVTVGSSNQVWTQASASTTYLAGDNIDITAGVVSLIDSPALTGTPTAPTASPADNSTKIATTAYADAAIAAVPDATTSLKGKVKLAGDLGGTAALPLTKTRTYSAVIGTSGSTADYICPGTADHTMIQTAIDAVYAAGGGRIWVRRGTYNPTSSIEIKEGVYLEGEGYATFFDMPDGVAINFTAILSGGVTKIRTDASTHSGNNYTIGAISSKDIVIEDNFVLDNKAFGILVLASSAGDRTAERIWIRRNHCTGLGNNDVIGGGTGNSTDTYCNDIWVEDNYVYQDASQGNNYDTAIDLVRVNRSSFTGNKTWGSVFFGSEATPNTRSMLSHNQIHPAGGSMRCLLIAQHIGIGSESNESLNVSDNIVESGSLRIQGHSSYHTKGVAVSGNVVVFDSYKDAVNFDGTDDYGLAADSASLRIETGNKFSIASWVQLDSYSNNNLPRIWQKRNHYVGIVGDSGDTNYRKIVLSVVDSSGATHNFYGSTQLLTDVAYHIGVTFDGTLGSAWAKIYLNGVAQTVTADVAWPGGETVQSTSTYAFYVARQDADTTRNLDGKLDDMIVFQNQILSSTQMLRLMDTKTLTGYEALWRFNEGTGTTVTDESGNSNTLTLTNGPTWIDSFTTPRGFNGALELSYLDGAAVSGNVLSYGTNGIYAYDCSYITYTGNEISKVTNGYNGNSNSTNNVFSGNVFDNTVTNKFVNTSSTDAIINPDAETGKVVIGGNENSGSRLHLYENDTTVTAGAGFTVEQAGTGDAIVQWLLTGIRRWVAGIDNSDSDKFKISPAADLANAKFAMDITGDITITSKLTISEASGAATHHLLSLSNAGTGTALDIDQTGTLADSKRALSVIWNGDNSNGNTAGIMVDSSFAHTGLAERALLRARNQNVASTANTLTLDQSGIGAGISIVNSNIGHSIEIDQNASSASSISGIVLDVDNTSTGGAIGMDIANITAISGTVVGLKIAVPSGGTSNYALQLSDTGGTSAGGVTLGTDTNLYRSAADTLKTDDKLIVTNSVGAGGVSPVSIGHLYQSDTNTGTATGLTIEQASTGDAVLQFLLTGVKRMFMGLDNSDSDKFKIGFSSGVDGSTALTLTTDGTGNMTLGGGLTLGTDLAVTEGGTGASTLTGILKGNGTSAFTAVTAPTGTLVGTSDTQTLTNKRVTPRVTSITSSATPTINTDNCDAVTITALAADITSMTTNLSGTPTNFDKLIVRIKDNGTARAITWGASFVARGIALPTTTVISKVLTVGFIYNTVTSTWDCVASAQEA